MAGASLVVLLATALLAGCSALDAPVPGPLQQYPAPNGVPTTEQTNVSPYPVLSRLGRWAGNGFVPVTPGSIAAGDVVVMTHGWAAGLLPVYEAAQAASTDLVTMWDPAMVDGSGQPVDRLFAGLAAALVAADPTTNVLLFSWIDQSSTMLDPLAAYAPERATEVNGNRMAVAIEQALTPGFVAGGGRLHLVGHSFGANVATTAAIALRSTDLGAPRQLTLFDSPEVDLARIGGAKNDLRYKLPRLEIGRTAGTTFVDNYISLVGEPYAGYPGLGQVVDVRLEPPAADPGVDKHQFPIGWYAASAAARNSDVGLWWSPLVGADDTALATSWRQVSADPAEQLVLEPTGPVPTPESNRAAAIPVRPVALALTVDASNPVANGTITIDDDSLWLTFDAGLVGAPTDTFHLFIDGRERSVMMGGSASDPPSRFVILYDLEPGEHVVSLVAEGATEGSPPSASAAGRLTNTSIASTSDIQRNLTPTETRRLVVWILLTVILAVVLVLTVLVLATVWAVRRVRRHRHPTPTAG